MAWAPNTKLETYWLTECSMDEPELISFSKSKFGLIIAFNF